MLYISRVEAGDYGREPSSYSLMIIRAWAMLCTFYYILILRIVLISVRVIPSLFRNPIYCQLHFV
jgi:hypothetical protein